MRERLVKDGKDVRDVEVQQAMEKAPAVEWRDSVWSAKTGKKDSNPGGGLMGKCVVM